ncbi:hypothetical protein J6A31_04925 [bacterium]|nr:hypothetical protein [bacterium]
MLDTTILVDVKSNGDGTYDTYIATENSSGSHYPAIIANTVGEYVADLIDTLEEEDSGKSYIVNNDKYLMTCFDNITRSITSLRVFDTVPDAYDAVMNEINSYYDHYPTAKTSSMKRPLLDSYDKAVAEYSACMPENGKTINLTWNITKL